MNITLLSFPTDAEPRPAGAVSGPTVAARQSVPADTQSVARTLRFEAGTDPRQVVVRVYDADTGMLVREIPPDEVRRLINPADPLVGTLADAHA